MASDELDNRTAHETFQDKASWAARELARVEEWKDEKGAEIKLRACKMILENAGFKPKVGADAQLPLSPEDLDRLEIILAECPT